MMIFRSHPGRTGTTASAALLVLAALAYFLPSH
jgi:hypothetical protein